MTKFVPYIAEEDIERDAAALLAEYAQARRIVIVPPIPIEYILEKHLKLGIEFDNTHSLFGVPSTGTEPDILGAMFFNESRIVIDESLDPEEYPSKEGRYRFTLAHEGGGHWRLHRRQFTTNPGQSTLFAGPTPPSVICRSSQAKERVEWQADFYASCLLMPRKLVFAAWALAALREDTREWWADILAREPEELDEGDEPATADRDGLRRFIEGEVLPYFENRKKELANRPLIREQAFGESLDADKLERLGRYEVHLDRKLERMLSMLLRLKEMRVAALPSGNTGS